MRECTYKVDESDTEGYDKVRNLELFLDLSLASGLRGVIVSLVMDGWNYQ